jgi:DNA-binding response OmpR family regulator
VTAPLDPSARINLRTASVLVLDVNPEALDVTRQLLNGFGVRAVHACDTAEAARHEFQQRTLELIVIDPLLNGGEDGFGLIAWMRREDLSPNRCTPIIAALSHNTLGNVKATRDAGANFVVAKPLSPELLLQRIEWIARENRQFIIAPGYVGPDRRFKKMGPPPGTDGRRADDLTADVPVAAEPNMSQLEVDELFKPMKVTL